MKSRTGIWRIRVALLSVVALFGGSCTPTPTPDPVSALPNPDLVDRCGIDINVVVDRSNSVAGSHEQLMAGVNTLVEQLQGTPSRIRLASFGGFGSGHPNGQNEASYALGALTWSPIEGYPVPPLTGVQGPYGDVFPEQGSTNLEGGLEVIRRAPGPVGDITIVLTDGEPNEHYLLSPNGSPGPNVNLGNALSEAISEANMLKQAGSHMLAVGVTGWGGVTESTLKDISGPDEFGTVKFEQADYASLTSFNEIPSVMRRIASSFCQGVLTLTKKVGQKGEFLPVCNYPFGIHADPIPTEWPGGPDADVDVVTCNKKALGGTVIIPFTASGPTTDFTITEQDPSLQFESVTCTRSDPINGGQVPHPVTVIDAVAGIFELGIDAGAEVHCTVLNVVSEQVRTGSIALTTVVPNPKDGTGTLAAFATGVGTVGVAVPGFALLSGAYETSQLTLTPEPGWFVKRVTCDGIELPGTTANTITVPPGTTVYCTAEMSRAYKTGRIELMGWYPAETGPSYAVDWKLQFPTGTSSAQRVSIEANAASNPSFRPSAQWNVDAGSPYTLTQASADRSVSLESIDCTSNLGRHVAGDEQVVMSVDPGEVMQCRLAYSRTLPVTVRVTPSFPSAVPKMPTVEWQLISGSGNLQSATGPADQTYLFTDMLEDFSLVFVPVDKGLYLKAIDCSVGGATATSIGDRVKFSLTSGQSAECVATFVPG